MASGSAPGVPVFPGIAKILGSAWNGGFLKEKQRNEFHRKNFQHVWNKGNLHSFPKERLTLLHKTWEQKHPRKPKEKIPTIFSQVFKHILKEKKTEFKRWLVEPKPAKPLSNSPTWSALRTKVVVTC